MATIERYLLTTPQEEAELKAAAAEQRSPQGVRSERDRTRYRVRYRTPDRRQTDKKGFTSKRAAEEFAATVEVSKLRGEFIEHAEPGEHWGARSRLAGPTEPSEAVFAAAGGDCLAGAR